MATTANILNHQSTSGEWPAEKQVRKPIYDLNAPNARKCTAHEAEASAPVNWNSYKKTPKYSFEETMRNRMRETSSKFIKIQCPKCKNEQLMFGKASSIVLCLICGKELAEPTGGKSKVKARVLEILD